VTFVYAKVSQGVTGKDAKFAEFWKRLGKLQKGHEVHRGAYHFLSSSTDAIAQANTFLTLLEQNGGLAATDMPPVLDLEWDSRRTDPTDQWKNHTADQILDKTMKWLEHVQKKTGRAPLVYTNSVWWRERIGSEQKFAALKGFPIWIADYSTSARAVEVPRVPNKTPWALWQFTDGALVGTTFKNGLDANIFKGSKKDFHAAFKVSPF
jgi:lysozyme